MTVFDHQFIHKTLKRMKNLGTVFKTIDAYPKTLEDFTIRTATGALGMILILSKNTNRKKLHWTMSFAIWDIIILC